MNAQIGSLQDVLDDAVLTALDRRRDVMDATDEDTPYGGSLGADLGSGTYSFIGRERLDARLHFVGSAAPGPNSWLWGWNNVNGFPDAVVARAGQLRDFGQRFGIRELSDGETPLTADPKTSATAFGAVASLICGLPFWLLDAGQGTVGALLLESPAFAGGPSSIVRASTVLPEAAELGLISDWSRALRSYATYRGFGIEEAPASITLRAGDGHLVGTLDDQGRLRSLDVSAGPSVPPSAD
ncbi:DUF6882 domain-containing protein [Beutenbergia cavernae]|nr:DUF6882 domain-containing protein [Beutenbergia cavernae]